ncbi:1-aminocyclopropane-1-carboxylate deaminase [Lachnellula suecica]|uniref:1-aminocyclopropane-1-carboxylate deaminase n=1 Tax=Lachnellula suecica TaxID=602035 RepID=A0A8T9CEA0_9HELO|nr:1-aminocyclopropane-1-carboxylate deaminase [Lachnellula suecica]
MASKEREFDTYFDIIVVPCATGSTLGGMIAGFKLLEKTDSSYKDSNRRAGLPWDQPVKIGLSESDIQERDVVIEKSFNAGKYGIVDDLTQAGMKVLASLEGILTDPVYTGKTMNGMICRAQAGDFEKSENILFVNIGGVPALSAYPDVR